MPQENFYITISKASPFVSYLPRLNQEIAKYKANGTVAALIAQYKKEGRVSFGRSRDAGHSQAGKSEVATCSG